MLICQVCDHQHVPAVCRAHLTWCSFTIHCPAHVIAQVCPALPCFCFALLLPCLASALPHPAIPCLASLCPDSCPSPAGAQQSTSSALAPGQLQHQLPHPMHHQQPHDYMHGEQQHPGTPIWAPQPGTQPGLDNFWITIQCFLISNNRKYQTKSFLYRFTPNFSIKKTKRLLVLVSPSTFPALCCVEGGMGSLYLWYIIKMGKL